MNDVLSGFERRGDTTGNSLTVMIEAAAAALARATTSAEVLDAAAHATVAYDAAKIAARFAKMKQAHVEIIAVCHKAMADALEIEAQAQCRIADEYDAAQQRGEVAKPGEYDRANIPNENISPKVTDIGLTSKQVHNARKVRDAEQKSPGIIRKTLSEQLSKGEAPTRADIKRAIEPKPIVAAAPPSPAPRVTAPEPAAHIDDDDYYENPYDHGCFCCGEHDESKLVLLNEINPRLVYHEYFAICFHCVSLCVETIERRRKGDKA